MLRFLKANPSVRVTIVYGLFALTWIGYFSFYLEPDVTQPNLYWFLRRYEAIAFAIMTACLFFLLVRSEFENRQIIERALRTSEELFTTVTRLSPAGIFRTDSAGVCTYVNESWVTITGVPGGVGLPWIVAIAPEDPDAVAHDWEASREARVPMRATLLLRRPPFEVRWLQVEVHPEGADSGAGFVGAIADITEGKLAEIAMQESEARYRTLIERIPAVTFTALLDDKNTFTFISPQVRTMLGFTVEEWIDSPGLWLEQMHPEDRSQAANALFGKKEGPVRCEYRLLRKDGGIRRVVTEAATLRGEAGGESHLHGLIFDVTEMRRTEAALEQLNRRYEAVVNSLDGIVWELDVATFRHTLVSDQAERVLGFRSEDWLRESGFWMRHVHPDDSHKAMAHYKEVIQTRTTKAVDYRLLGHAGRTVWVHDAVSPVVVGDRVTKLRGVMMDVSERKHFELELSRLNEELEKRVGKRTSELEAVVDELRSFSYSVSHDLRSPLRAIQGFGLALDREYRDRLDETGRDYLHRILGSADRMTKLIEDLITLSRVTHIEMRTEPLDLTRIAGEVVADLRTSEPLRRVEMKIAPNLIAAGDARLVRVMLENLLGNAWKFTSRKLQASVEFAALEQRSGKTVFFVRDDGAGFDQEFASKLFMPFQRLHRVTEFPGTGIGLATVARILGRHGGRIWAEGREGSGATFYFEL
ncbi:MAG TPA: PAS domain S-box protein [Opitutaceae bacterium]|nr:PAS domain S-box protein [Opitutaceae bacterium]